MCIRDRYISILTIVAIKGGQKMNEIERKKALANEIASIINNLNDTDVRRCV